MFKYINFLLNTFDRYGSSSESELSHALEQYESRMWQAINRKYNT